MDRRGFIKLCQLLGLNASIPGIVTSATAAEFDSDSNVIVIGAGAAGLTAAYLLNQYGVNFQILEASDKVGGRMKTNTDFASFPICLGAEWIHVDPEILQEIINDNSISIDIDTARYKSSDTYAVWKNNELNIYTIDEPEEYKDQKFIQSSWLDFYKEYILPSISNTIRFNTQVTSINYSGEQVYLGTTTGKAYTADKVIITIPLKILQQNHVAFTPDLPDKKRKAIETAKVWPGLKAFFEFEKQFYPTFLELDKYSSMDGELLYYDASYAQNTNQSILGLFSVGETTKKYLSLSSNELKDYVLKELDVIFKGQASKYFIKHLIQDWTKEPFIGAAYLNNHENYRKVKQLSKPVDKKLYFAGEAYTDGNDWGSVHTAAYSAYETVEKILS